MIRHRVVENTFARAYPPADGEGGGIGDGAYGRPYFRDDSAAAAPEVSDQSLRERARLLDTVRVIDQLKELGTLDPGQLRDLSQWLQAGGGSGIERNAFWQGVLGNPFDPFGDLGIAAQQRGLDAVRARNQRPGYDWQDEGRARGDEARAGLGLGRFGLASEDSGESTNETTQGAAPDTGQLELDLPPKLSPTDLIKVEVTVRLPNGQATWTELYRAPWAPGDPGPDGTDPSIGVVAGALLGRIGSPGVTWSPPQQGGGWRVRPNAPDSSSTSGRLGPIPLADEPSRRRALANGPVVDNPLARWVGDDGRGDGRGRPQ